jgi:hypothetical protein
MNPFRNMYSSEKVLQMSYANYQGKEALVEKFRNSPIMRERDAWRPKIFYSDGPMRGEREEFPEPTHKRRMERGDRAAEAGVSGAGLLHHNNHGGQGGGAGGLFGGLHHRRR